MVFSSIGYTVDRKTSTQVDVVCHIPEYDEKSQFCTVRSTSDHQEMLFLGHGEPYYHIVEQNHMQQDTELKV